MKFSERINELPVCDELSEPHKDYRNLIVWSLAMDVVDEIYNLSKHFPEDERFGLRSQITRSAISIPSNIAEGYGRFSDVDFTRLLRISLGSLYECWTQLEIARRRSWIP